jgi:hypothetical protein
VEAGPGIAIVDALARSSDRKLRPRVLCSERLRPSLLLEDAHSVVPRSRAWRRFLHERGPYS